MENYIIAAVIIVAAAVGFVYTLKHFKGQSGCCGGGGYKHKHKKLSRVIYTKTFRIGGMHCENCKNRVEEIVDGIDNIAGKVDLKKGELTVSYSAEVDDGLMIKRIERAGYTVSDSTSSE